MDARGLWSAVLALPGVLGFAYGCRDGPERLEPGDEEAFRAARERMVAEQLVARGIRDERVLAAMRAAPRHRFVPEDRAAHAYEDRPLAIGWGQTISQPFVVAFMSAALELRGDERVLEVGTGSGYQTALLSALAAEVWSIEIVAPLAERASATLAGLGHVNVHVRSGDGYLGWPEAAPFDAILVAAAPDHLPQPLLDQLAPHGRLIAPVGDATQQLVRVRRTETGFLHEEMLPVRFVPMTGIAAEGGASKR